MLHSRRLRWENGHKEQEIATAEVQPLPHNFFDGAKIEIHIILYLSIMWIPRCAVKQVLTFSKKILNATVCNYYSHFCCQLAANMIDDSKAKIGGPGIEVEVDESKFAKRKYHRTEATVWVPKIGFSAGLKNTPVQLSSRSSILQ